MLFEDLLLAIIPIIERTGMLVAGLSFAQFLGNNWWLPRVRM
jgi:hypothetical protein